MACCFATSGLASTLGLNDFDYDFYLALVSRGCKTGLSLGTQVPGFQCWACMMISWTTVSGLPSLRSLITLSLFFSSRVVGSDSSAPRAICTVSWCSLSPSTGGESPSVLKNSSGKDTDRP